MLSSKSNDDSQPQLVYHCGNTAIYRRRDPSDESDTGIKVLLSAAAVAHLGSPSCSVDDLLHEHFISSQHLHSPSHQDGKLSPTAVAARRTIAFGSFRGRPALYYHWSDGNTLKDWLRKSRGVTAFRLRLRAGAAIARTLRDFHRRGVVSCGGLRAENVVLGAGEAVGAEGYVATFVDLKRARVLEDAPDAERRIEDDLKDLGRVLDQLFGGASDYAPTFGDDGVVEIGRHIADSDEGLVDDSKRGRTREDPGAGLPPRLGSLIAALLEAPVGSGAGLGYENAGDVYEDLRAMAEGDAREWEDGAATATEGSHAKGKLKWRGDAAYGREKEYQALMGAFQESVAPGRTPQMAIVSGYAGTGKSEIVRRLREALTDDHGARFIHARFIEGIKARPSRWDFVLPAALDAFFGTVLAEEEEAAAEKADNDIAYVNTSMKWRILDALGSVENSPLLEVLPNLKKWLAPESLDVGANGMDGNAEGVVPVRRRDGGIRLKFLICNLIGAISCKDRPLVFFLGDLKLADTTTLDIVQSIMTDPKVRHVLFLGTCKGGGLLTTSAKAMQQELGACVTNVNIAPFDKECACSLLSETLCLPHGLCRSLAAVAHNKTGGITSHFMDFLNSCNDEGSLSFSVSHRRWVYDLKKIRNKEINEVLVQHLIDLVSCASKGMRTGFKVAACLGLKFNTNLMKKVEREYSIKPSFLSRCVHLGFLVPLGPEEHAWAHERIRQAAFDLIPETQRESFPLLLGTRLFLQSSSYEMKNTDTLSVVVDNMNRGARMIADPRLKREASQLNLDAGQNALAALAFHSAAEYLTTGVSLLESSENHWEENYGLSMNLHDAASEALFAIGDFARLSSVIEKPLMHAHSFMDKLNIYNNLIRSLAASSEFERGFAECLNVLSELGEAIPTDITTDMHDQEVAQIKKLLEGKSRQVLLSLPIMSDPKKMAAMLFLDHAMTITSIINPQLSTVLVFRMVKLSIEHGICNISAFAFSCYGVWLTSEPNFNVDAGHKMGKVAMEMMYLLGAVDMVPRCNLTVYASINTLKEPWQACQSKRLEAYDAAVTSGDMHYAMNALYQFSDSALYGCGNNLEIFSQSIQLYSTRAFRCNQQSFLKSLVILHQLALDLRGVEQNAFLPYATGTTEESCFSSSQDQHEISICRLICEKKKYQALFMQDMSTAAEMHILCQEFPKSSTGHLLSLCVSTFIDGLIGFSLARKQGCDKSKWLAVGNEAMLSLRKWRIHSEWNFSNKLHLLEAEYAVLKDDDEQAISSYQASIKAARDHRFIHEEGLAEEKLGLYLKDKKEYISAKRHFSNAKECYKRWGAHAIVNRMNQVDEDVEDKKIGAASRSHLDGLS